MMPAAAADKSLQSCPTPCDPIDGSPPGSPVPGTLQTRTLEWVAISFSNEWKWNVKEKSLSRVRLWCLLLLLLSRFSRVQLCAIPQTAAYQAPPSMGFSRQEYWSGLPWPSPEIWCLVASKFSFNFWEREIARDWGFFLCLSFSAKTQLFLSFYLWNSDFSISIPKFHSKSFKISLSRCCLLHLQLKIISPTLSLSFFQMRSCPGVGTCYVKLSFTEDRATVWTQTPETLATPWDWSADITCVCGFTQSDWGCNSGHLFIETDLHGKWLINAGAWMIVRFPPHPVRMSVCLSFVTQSEPQEICVSMCWPLLLYTKKAVAIIAYT